MLSLLAVSALSAVAAGTASAGLPTWRASGEPLPAAKKITISSGVSRLWAPSLGIVIVCGKDKGTGTIVNEGSPLTGVDTAKVTFEECAAWSSHETGEEQVVQNEKLCPTANIVVETKSHLAYVPWTGGKEILDPQEPKEGKIFTTIVLKTSEGCPSSIAGEYKVEGSVLCKVPRNQVTLVPEYTEEAVQQDLLCETTNEPKVSNVFQRYEEYETTPRKRFTDTLTLAGKAAAFESTEILEKEEAKPEPFGVHS
jgi:hypothetical protein